VYQIIFALHAIYYPCTANLTLCTEKFALCTKNRRPFHIPMVIVFVQRPLCTQQYPRGTKNSRCVRCKGLRVPIGDPCVRTRRSCVREKDVCAPESAYVYHKISRVEDEKAIVYATMTSMFKTMGFGEKTTLAKMLESFSL